MRQNTIDQTLIEAIKSNHLERLKAVSDIMWLNASDRRNPNVLFLAVRQKAHNALLYLMDIGLDIHAANRHGERLLHLAAHLGDAFVVRLLIQRGLSVDITNNKGQTALMLAALKGSLDTVDILIDKAANLFATDEEGSHVLMYAIKSKKPKILKRLLQEKTPVHLANHKGETVLHILASQGVLAMYQLLRPHAINPYRTNLYAQTPLHYAAIAQVDTIIEPLLEAGLNSYDRDLFDMTPFDLAHKHGQHDAINYFTRMKNDPTLQNHFATHPLHRALRFKDFEGAHAYIKQGHQLDVHDCYGNTPLFYALMIKDVMLVKALLHRQVSTEDIDALGTNAWTHAILSGEPALLSAVLPYVEVDVDHAQALRGQIGHAELENYLDSVLSS